VGAAPQDLEGRVHKGSIQSVTADRCRAAGVRVLPRRLRAPATTALLPRHRGGGAVLDRGTASGV